MKRMQKLYESPYLPVGILLLLHTLAWLLMHPLPTTGPGDDAFAYVNLAKSIFSPGFHLSYDQFQNRFGVYVPVYFIFRWLGENPYTTALWPLCMSLLTIGMSYRFLIRLAGKRVAFIAGSLVAMNLEQVDLSLVLFPDLLVAGYATFFVFLLYYAREMGRKEIFLAALLQLIWITGFLTKETMLLTLPYTGILAVADLTAKKNRSFWKATGTFSLISCLALAWGYYALTGDPFHRLRSMQEYIHYRMPVNDDPAADIRAHNSGNLLIWLNHNLHYLFVLLLSLPVMYTNLKAEGGGLKKYLSGYAIYLLLLFSFLFYLPGIGTLFMQSRHWTFVIVPLAMLAAFFITGSDRTSLRLLIGIFAFLGVYNFFAVGPFRAALFALFLTAAGADYYFLEYKGKRMYLLLLPFLGLLSYYIFANTNFRPENAGHYEQIQDQK